MKERATIHSEKIIQAGISSVWSYISNPSDLIALSRSELGIRTLFADANTENLYGSEAMRYVFTARVSLHNILLTGTGCSYAIRLSAHGESCRILIAAASDETSFIAPKQVQLDNFLQRIEYETQSKQSQEEDAFFSSLHMNKEHETDTPDTHKPKKLYHADEDDSETGSNTIDVTVSDSSDLISNDQDDKSDSYESPVLNKKQEQRSHKPRWPILFVALAALVAVVCAAYMFIPAFRSIFVEQIPEYSGYSANVNYRTAMKISPGDSRGSVEETFGSDGVPAPGKYENRMVYRGGNLSENGLYTFQVCVDYLGTAVSRITYLDLGVAAHLESPFDQNAEITADMSMEAIVGAVGVPASMTRVYKSGGEDIVEMHFGFTDPFANFDPAWRGEFAVTINKTAQTVDKQFWSGYDGSDPLMINSLDGHPVANQYDDYTEFLNDKYHYDHALYMLNRYSRGDVIRVFGEITLYDDTSGADLYYHNSEETLSDGQPVYVFTFGFDTKGQFLMSSFSNMRLFPQQDMLLSSSYGDIMRGMAYNEVRYLMQVLPTAIWIDQNYFTLCYGQKLDSNVFESSFEFIVRIDIDNNYVQTIWNNMPSAS